ncbi:pif-3 [Sucra jujuba nucleopolyhedrovirus]|uniref:Pif-3 n=1 Tax=Sucra jujuba nucleopolyhedrovirus TaxID=1563660 RepID=A0A097P959_9ABAC|nr:pif-3 [Sucra jujuba nucleopolyhedrovirus]AIU41339.1 pif-3 [Sucra jujuba nucleopolyhedrovirus]
MNFTSYYVGFLLLLLVFFILYIFTMRYVRQLFILQEQEIEADTQNPMTLVFSQNGIVDCVQTKLPCVSNRQCTDNCALQNAIGVLECDQGFCVLRDPQIAGNRPDDFECDPKLGLVKVFAASEFVVDQLCISLYRDVFDDLGDPRPYVCDSGDINVDLVERPFSIEDCRCSNGFTRMVFNQTALARSIPVCIPNLSANLFSRIYNEV